MKGGRRIGGCGVIGGTYTDSEQAAEELPALNRIPPSGRKVDKYYDDLRRKHGVYNRLAWLDGTKRGWW